MPPRVVFPGKHFAHSTCTPSPAHTVANYQHWLPLCENHSLRETLQEKFLVGVSRVSVSLDDADVVF